MGIRACRAVSPGHDQGRPGKLASSKGDAAISFRMGISWGRFHVKIALRCRGWAGTGRLCPFGVQEPM